MAYKYKLNEMSKTASPEAAAKELERKDGEGFQVGQVTYAADGQSKSTITNIDSETGAVSWKITQLPGFDKLYDEMDQLVDVSKRVYVKTKDDDKFREIYDEARKLRNKVRTHLRNEYPDEYKRMTRIGEAYSGFIRNPEDPDYKKFEPTSQRIKGKVDQFKEDLRTLFGKFKGDLNNPDFIRGVAEIMVSWKSLLRSQMSETDVDEASMSGAAGAYNTPYAFVRKKLKKGKKKKGVKMNKPSGLVNYMDYSVNEGNEEAITYFQQAIKLSHTNKVRNLILKAAKELGLEIPKVWTETVNENNKNPGATLGPGPKASENGVADNAYVKQFKYKLVKKNKDGTYVQPPSTLPVRKLWGE